jgi:prepilin-type N-terminal cleavage/methylation domain-containing protein
VRLAGFTLIELMIVMIILVVIGFMSFGALQRVMIRSRLEGGARQISVFMQQARLEAIKFNTRVVVRADYVNRSFSGFRDNLGLPNNTRDVGELAVGPEDGVPLPAMIDFAAPGGFPVVEGFDEDAGVAGYTVFLGDGSVEEPGALRIADRRGNFLEIQVKPKATARVELRKFDGAAFRAQGELGKSWTFD